jgi:hypothetical protein
MLAFVVCLVFNAYPDTWLSDEEFDRMNPTLGRAYNRLDRIYAVLPATHVKILLRLRTDLRAATNAANALPVIVGSLNRDIAKLNELRTRQRLLALTDRKEYMRENFPGMR